MEPVLEIKTIPISIEYMISRGYYEVANTDASVKISYREGSLEIEMNPIKLNLDKIDINYSSGSTSMIGAETNSQNYRIDGTYTASNAYLKEGNMVFNLNITSNNNDSDIVLQKFNSDISFNFNSFFESESKTSWDKEQVFTEYEMDKLNFDWKMNRPEIKFIPGNIEFIIKEYPRIEINYIGTPIFVPPSSDPNYKPIDTKA
jgi:hypothetical protein